MLYFSWVKETAEVVRYEALFPLHPFVDTFHYYRLEKGLGTLSGHCACSYAIGSALGSLALKKKHVTKMSDCPGALVKLVLRKMHTKTSLMKLKFSARKAVHNCYQCWKFELNISSDSGDMHFSATRPRRGGCPPSVRLAFATPWFDTWQGCAVFFVWFGCQFF